MLEYLAKRQSSPLPFLPIRSIKERKLAHLKINECLASEENINNQTTLELLSKNWNKCHISIQNKIS